MKVNRVLLSPDGPEVSQIALGLWRLIDWGVSPTQVAGLLEDCLEMGITTFDHADIYGGYRCEAEFGEALSKLKVAREDIQLVTKCDICLVSEQRPDHRVHCYDTSKPHILRSVENSLRNLRTDFLDVLLLHRPDPLMNAGEVAEVFTELRGSGKVLHFGVSNFLPSQVSLLSSALEFPLVTNQLEYSALEMKHQTDGALDQCQQLGIRPMVWSPFAGGRLFTDGSEKPRRVRAAMEEVSTHLGGATLGQIALAWILTHPAGCVPVLGTGKTDRVREAAAATRLRLTRAQWFSIWEASMGHEVP
jgi:predicted oxidoreductase